MSVDSCLVHGSEHASKFQATLTKLRRIHEFSEIIYKQMAQHCCSCYGTTNCTSIDLDTLRKMCLGLTSKTTTKKDEDDEDFQPLRLKKNKKKQLMKSDRENDLKEQWDDYEDEVEFGTDADSSDAQNSRPTFTRKYIPPRQAERMEGKRLKTEREVLALLQKLKSCEQFLAFFESIPVPDNCCMVHDKKYRSPFNNLLNQLRVVSKYPERVYNEFPRHCCSCKGERKISAIDPELFRKQLKEIQSRPVGKKQDEAVESFDWIILPYESELDDSMRRSQIGQFIGKDGRNLLAWQTQYNIRINIIDQSSKDKIKQRSETIGSVTDATAVVLSFEKRNKMIEGPLKTEEIKTTILAAWKAPKETLSRPTNRPLSLRRVGRNRLRGRKRF